MDVGNTGIPQFLRFRFKAVYNSILFSSPLVLSNHDLRGFCFPRFFMCPHINSVDRGMSVIIWVGKAEAYRNSGRKSDYTYPESTK